MKENNVKILYEFCSFWRQEELWCLNRSWIGMTMIGGYHFINKQFLFRCSLIQPIENRANPKISLDIARNKGQMKYLFIHWWKYVSTTFYYFRFYLKMENFVQFLLYPLLPLTAILFIIIYMSRGLFVYNNPKIESLVMCLK